MAHIFIVFHESLVLNFLQQTLNIFEKWKIIRKTRRTTSRARGLVDSKNNAADSPKVTRGISKSRAKRARASRNNATKAAAKVVTRIAKAGKIVTKKHNVRSNRIKTAIATSNIGKYNRAMNSTFKNGFVHWYDGKAGKRKHSCFFCHEPSISCDCPFTLKSWIIEILESIKI